MQSLDRGRPHISCYWCCSFLGRAIVSGFCISRLPCVSFYLSDSVLGVNMVILGMHSNFFSIFVEFNESGCWINLRLKTNEEFLLQCEFVKYRNSKWQISLMKNWTLNKFHDFSYRSEFQETRQNHGKEHNINKLPYLSVHFLATSYLKCKWHMFYQEQTSKINHSNGQCIQVVRS